MQAALNKIYSLLPSLVQSYSLIKQIAVDLSREDQGTTIRLPLDFYEMHNYLFPFDPGNRDPDVVKYYFENLTHPMILMPPSAWELVRHLEHQSGWLRTLYHPKSKIIDALLESRELQDFREKLEKGSSANEIVQAYNRMGKYHRILNFLRDDAVKTMLEEPAQEFVRLLESGRLVPLESVVDETAWQQLDEKIFKDTLYAFDERRPTVQKRIPNRVDALNLAIAFALNSKLYTSHSGGDFFVIVTHSVITEGVYSRIPWKDDPLLGGLEETPINRSHRYCAYRAYFEKEFTDARQAILDYAGDLDEVIIQQERFERLFQRFGRQYLAESSKTDPGVAAELRDIYKELQRLQERIVAIEAEIQPKLEVPPLGETDDLSDRLKSKDEIEATLVDRARAANEVAQMVFYNVEPVIRNFPITIVDREFEKTIRFITSPSVTAIAPEDPERFLIEAEFRGQSGNRPFDLHSTYVLHTGVRWYRPEGQTGPTELTFNVVVYAQDMDISPGRVQDLVVYPGKSEWLQFIVTPRSVGTKRLRVEFYHQLNGLGEIELEVRVVGNEEPAYRGLYESVVHDRRPVPVPSNIDPVTVHITQYRKSCYELSTGGSAYQRCSNCLSCARDCLAERVCNLNRLR